MTRIEFLPNRIRQMINFGNLTNELRNSYDEFLRQTWAKLPESPSFKVAELKDFRNIEVSPLSLTTFLGMYKAFGILNGGLTHSSFINRYSLLLHVPIFHKLSLVGDYAPEWKFKNVQALAQVVRLEATQAIEGMGEEMGQAIIDNLPPHKAYANKQRLVHRMMPLAQKISDIFSPFAQSAFLTLLLVGIDEGRMGTSFFANEAEALLEAKKLPTLSNNMDRLRWILNQHINRFLACFEAQRLPESQTADKVVFDATICLKDDLLSRSVARDLPRYRAFLQMARPAFEQANQALLSGDLHEGVVFPIKRSETQAGPLHLYYDVSILLTALGVVQKPSRRENMQVTAQSFRFGDVICRKWAALASGVPEAVAYQAASIFTAFGRLVKDSPEAAFNVVAGLPLEGVIQPQKGEEAIAILEPAYRRIAASFAPIIEDAVGAALGEVHGTYSTERNESAMHAAVRVASNLLKAQKDLRVVEDQAVANRIFGEVFMDNSCLLAESIRSAFTRPGGEWIYPEIDQEKGEASQAEETRAEDGERYEGAVPTQGEWAPSVESQAEDGTIQQGDMAPKKTSSRPKKAADKTAHQGYQR